MNPGTFNSCISCNYDKLIVRVPFPMVRSSIQYWSKLADSNFLCSYKNTMSHVEKEEWCSVLMRHLFYLKVLLLNKKKVLSSFFMQQSINMVMIIYHFFTFTSFIMFIILNSKLITEVWKLFILFFLYKGVQSGSITILFSFSFIFLTGTVITRFGSSHWKLMKQKAILKMPEKNLWRCSFVT